MTCRLSGLNNARRQYYRKKDFNRLFLKPVVVVGSGGRKRRVRLSELE
jgi:hypothetical protein